MDLGRVYCQARRVSCEICPISKKCVSFKNKNQLSLPISSLKKNKKNLFDLSLLRVLVEKKGKIYGVRRNKKEWLEGQIEVPTFTLHTNNENFNQYPSLNKKVKIKEFDMYRTSITKYKINNYIFLTTEKELRKISGKSFKLYKTYEANPSKINFSTATIKALKRVNILK